MAINKSDPAAHQYAKALLMIGQEQRCVGQLFEELNALTAAYREDAVFRSFFTSPKVPAALKERVVLEAVRNASETFRGFVTVLIRKRRETLLDNIMDSFGKYRDDAENRVHVWVETAQALDSSERAAITTRIATATEKTVVLHELVRPELIGGLRIWAGDSLLDNTIATRLGALSQKLAELDQLPITGAGSVDEIFERARKAPAA